MKLAPEEHRSLGVALFNRTWELMGTTPRTPEQDDELLATAYASAFHWLPVAEPVNRARSQWLLSRVHAVLGTGESATRHAQRCLEICGEHEIGDWDLAFAHEALARAAAVSGDVASARRHLADARVAGEAIADPDDRAVLDKDLATIPV